ncbi:acetyl/propionyl/methylcrotonyl-CoA carboxylase subunit alpha [Williamsia sterculiae]|uniref:biotin carboxylase n=1 Tax=Williamsia sterculiae TaxID=1344003 RepID=A0A1N7DIE2_9NOCA|nr:acetyl-CoA carboxylase biotin carboxylase subunit [Williamsia sterculiae]SIR75606.1 acetyl-CoA/propionyl-CoA carboxylase, biotin carboxylase, biotin carboxyl carrier protein [Williamsia sterculiae]
MTTTPSDPQARRSVDTVLVANRGEIACRVIETLRAMGIRSVAVYSDPDADARHVRLADTAVRIGPASAAQSYLSIPTLVAAARATGADAVHPGYGFLSENAGFADALAQADIVFVGPPAEAIRTMGDKITARDAVSANGVPVVPGVSRPGLSDDDLIAASTDIGYPLLIKPSAGGGGKGMHRVDDAADLPSALATARREAGAAFGDDTLFLERFVDTPRHIEVQVIADTHGSVIHLGERECSLQRRHQKVIEEAPSVLLDAATRARIGDAACDAARSVGYVGAGTVEFIVSANHPDEFFFMEMNTRLQVEHPVTEKVTGLDLVDLQVRVARGERLPLSQSDVHLDGHAVEARVYAEDPANGFLPTGGTVLSVTHPTGPGVRADSALYDGMVVGTDYDPMLAKVIAHGIDREDALRRLDRALADTRVLGLRTNIDFCRTVLHDPRVRSGDLHTELLDEMVLDYRAPAPPPEALALLGLVRVPEPGDGAWQRHVGWRLGDRAPVVTRVHTDAGIATVAVIGDRDGGDVTVTVAAGDVEDEDNDAPRSWHARCGWDGDRLTVDGVGSGWSLAEDPDSAANERLWIAGPGGTWELTLARTQADALTDDHSDEITSPMPGTVVAVGTADGPVTSGSTVVVIEAMKMEHALRAPADGDVTVRVAVGDKVTAGQILAVLEFTHRSDTSNTTEETATV